MTAVTTIIGKQVGVQFQGTQDKTNFPNLNRQSHLLMLVDDVGRGCLDRMMQVGYDTLKAKLGYSRESLIVQAVEDVLLTGVPSVSVMRCYTNKGTVSVKPMATDGEYGIYVDDVLVKTLPLDVLKQGLTYGAFSITWNNETQKFDITKS